MHDAMLRDIHLQHVLLVTGTHPQVGRQMTFQVTMSNPTLKVSLYLHRSTAITSKHILLISICLFHSIGQRKS